MQNTDLYWIFAGGLVVVITLMFNWSSLTLMTINEDLARAEGVNTLFSKMVLICLMTLVVAVSLRIVGILLVTSLLIIPAATARQWAKSPETMAIIACIYGLIAVIAGIFSSLYLDTPPGPSIVSASAILFFLVTLITLYIHKHSNS